MLGHSCGFHVSGWLAMEGGFGCECRLFELQCGTWYSLTDQIVNLHFWEMHFVGIVHSFMPLQIIVKLEDGGLFQRQITFQYIITAV